MSRRFLSMLGLLWLLWLSFEIGRVVLRASAPSVPRHDVTAQMLQSDPGAAAEPVQARLQVALLQMAASGPQTAVLCATSVPLQLDAPRQVYLHCDYRAPRTFWQGRRLDQAYYEQRAPKAGQFRALSWDAPEVFDGLQRGMFLELRWRGLRQGRDCLHVETSRVNSRGSRWSEGPCWWGHEATDWLPSLALVRSEPYFVWLSDGLVLAMRTQDAGGPDAPWTSFAKWQQSARSAREVEPPAAAELTRESGDPADGYVELSAPRSRDVASVVFLDPGLPLWRPIDGADDLTGIAPGGADEFGSHPDGMALFFRTLPQRSVESLQGCVAEMPEELLPQLIAFADVPVAPAIATVWAQVQHDARDRLWPTWMRWMPLPLRWLLMLAPLGVMAWTSLRPRRAVVAPVHLGGPALLLLASASWSSSLPDATLHTLGSAAVLLMLLVMSRRRLGAATPRLERVLLAGALCSSWLLLLWFVGLGQLLEGTLLGVLIQFHLPMWLVIGGWVLLDGQWRWSHVFAWALVVDALWWAAFVLWAASEDSRITNSLTFVMWAKALLFASFLVGGHRDAPLAAASEARA